MEWIGFFTPLPGTTNRGWTRSSTESFVSRMSLRRFSFFLKRLGLYAGKNMVASSDNWSVSVYSVYFVYLGHAAKRQQTGARIHRILTALTSFTQSLF